MGNAGKAIAVILDILAITLAIMDMLPPIFAIIFTTIIICFLIRLIPL